jgi:dipeptidyl aminopeptidase/acylaminoacyl peptidase
MKKTILLILLPFLLLAQEKRAITVEDLWSMKRLGNVVLSPDGKTFAMTVTSYDMEANKGNTDIYLMDVSSQNFRVLKNSEKNETEPQFLPDGKRISYIFENQVWSCNMDGSDEQKITDLYTGVSGHNWSNDGKKLLFVSSVYPDCISQDCNKERDKEKEQSKVKASLFTELMYRHWNAWRGEKRSHLFLYDLDSKEYYDLTIFGKNDVPPIALGSANDYKFSPEGLEVVFTMNSTDFIATSTNNDIFILNLKDVKKNAKNPFIKISESKGNDNQPVYSPDGKFIAFCSMEREGFESDKQDIIIYNRKTGSLKNITESFENTVEEIVWSNDSQHIYFTAPNKINKSIYTVNVYSGKVTLIQEKHSNRNVMITSYGKSIYFKQQRTNLPEEIFSSTADGRFLTQRTSLNKDLLSRLEMNPVETFWAKGAEGKDVQSILIKPPFFDASKKYPMIFLIHGGPQGHWSDEFHYRWNLQFFASKGYVVVAPNPRGSTGYGQKFVDEISGDWGGKVYIDLMNTYDHAVDNFSFVDKNNTFAAGASYGGYMINWIAGHTDRFNALVSHSGAFNLESKYGTTEELWFPEWEFGGTPWENREAYEKWSPHIYIHNANTPMLITHGANDFRVTVDQSMQLFTALQRLGVESQFLYFPDETHFITKPQNARLWWNTIFDWFEKNKKRDIQ